MKINCDLSQLIALEHGDPSKEEPTENTDNIEEQILLGPMNGNLKTDPIDPPSATGLRTEELASGPRGMLSNDHDE
eukprot:CAMPEP_0170498056 /NCGR_PEP_ID=MMETSP0208-20121228/26680_1 /TAXON_ID=197538 /ORGANISM="Strombidium inclinatum, Strain S3" /LENGTH=75 /DNA_ID=CAMNT_0010775107 /DNA_START=1571 /DNA_END=1798 /DNA_ORIENTATION=+